MIFKTDEDPIFNPGDVLAGLVSKYIVLSVSNTHYTLVEATNFLDKWQPKPNFSSIQRKIEDVEGTHKKIGTAR